MFAQGERKAIAPPINASTSKVAPLILSVRFNLNGTCESGPPRLFGDDRYNRTEMSRP